MLPFIHVSLLLGCSCVSVSQLSLPFVLMHDVCCLQPQDQLKLLKAHLYDSVFIKVVVSVWETLSLYMWNWLVPNCPRHNYITQRTMPVRHSACFVLMCWHVDTIVGCVLCITVFTRTHTHTLVVVVFADAGCIFARGLNTDAASPKRAGCKWQWWWWSLHALDSKENITLQETTWRDLRRATASSSVHHEASLPGAAALFWAGC